VANLRLRGRFVPFVDKVKLGKISSPKLQTPCISSADTPQQCFETLPISKRSRLGLQTWPELEPWNWRSATTRSRSFARLAAAPSSRFS